MRGPSRRVLFCTWGYAPSPTGGAEQQARLQATELTRRGVRVTVVCPQIGVDKSGSVDGVDVVRLRRLNRRPFKTISYLILLALFLLRNMRSFAIVHVHLANAQADVAVLMGLLLRRPVYVKVAAGGGLGEVRRMQRVSWLSHYIGIKHATRVQALSDEIFEELIGIGVDRARVVRIPNGVALDHFVPANGSLRLASRGLLGLPMDSPIVLFVGRLATYKGIPELLQIWRSDRRPPATLVMVGSLKHTHLPVAGFVPPERVIVRDHTSSIATYYQAADIFVLPSHIEGMSNALLEAMASGLPSVVTAVGAHGKLIRHGENGLVVPVGDVEKLGAAMTLLLGDSQLRTELGKSARQSVQEYSVESVVDRVCLQYANIASADICSPSR